MLNEAYILSLINPYLNSKRELSEFEFFELFSELDRQEQYEIINIMIRNDIEYVDEKEEETKILDSIPMLVTNTDTKDFRQILNLKNEQLCIMYQQGDIIALSALIEKNKRFVYQMAMKISKEYRQHTLTIDDMYMEGNLGLIEAIEKFEASKGYMFTTYAWHWIRQKIVRAIIDTGYLIRIPVHMFEKIIKVNKCRKLYPDASVEEMREYLEQHEGLNIEVEKLDELIVYSDLYMNTYSLNDVVGENGDTERIEFIPDDNVSIEDIVIGKQLKEDLKEILLTLSERERNILDLRFGLTSGESMTLEDIGDIYNVTRERIRQIEVKALKRLRHPARANRLKGYY